MSLFRSDETDPRKKFFHHNSVSVPIESPSRPGMTARYDIPFGPPVIHAEPEKTAEQVQEIQFNMNRAQNGMYFNISGPSIIPPEYEESFFDNGDDDNMETEE